IFRWICHGFIAQTDNLSSGSQRNMRGVGLGGGGLVSSRSCARGRFVMVTRDSQHAPKHRQGGGTPANHYQKNYQWRCDHRWIPF
ncbi:hypothetical protein, partial [Stutzerimonas stutzeri]|uniref:hypothetical protein n=1 Tax=Stutzerimonas stutzeri TaxID=316 RepID=UPI00210A7BF2